METTVVKPTPKGWPRMSSAVFYKNAGAAIDWLVEAFGFDVRLKIEGEGGRIEHSELTYGTDGLVMVGEERASEKDKQLMARSPRSVGGACTQTIMVFVDDVDAHCAHARGKGAVIDREPSTTDYGEEYWTDRTYGCQDLEGHYWWFVQRLK